jgi:hypothetical protein
MHTKCVEQMLSADHIGKAQDISFKEMKRLLGWLIAISTDLLVPYSPTQDVNFQCHFMVIE